MALSVASPANRVNKLISDIVLTILALIFLLPLAWVILASFDKEATLAAAIPKAFSIDNYLSVLTPEQTFIPLLNSFILSMGTAVLTVIIAMMAAYPLSRYHSRFNSGYMYTILFASGLPITAMMIPVYSLFVQLNLLDQQWAVILFLTASSLPMAIFMSKNFMDGIPISLEEAAWVDGANSVQTFRSVVMPLMGPGLATVGIFVFVSVWGNFFVPFILFVNQSKMPAAVTIYSFFGQHGMVGYGALAAFSVIYTIPTVILYLIITRSFGAFALAGGIKG